MKENERRMQKYSRRTHDPKGLSQDRFQERGRGTPGSSQKPMHSYAPPRQVYEERREELKPAPIGSMCSSTCPIFRCTKKSLMIKLVSGRPTAFCMWVNDSCIGYKCQFSFCFQRYLLPDGKCSAAVKSTTPKEDAFIKELERLNEDKGLKNLLSRKGFGKDLLY